MLKSICIHRPHSLTRVLAKVFIGLSLSGSPPRWVCAVAFPSRWCCLFVTGLRLREGGREGGGAVVWAGEMMGYVKLARNKVVGYGLGGDVWHGGGLLVVVMSAVLRWRGVCTVSIVEVDAGHERLFIQHL